jgi:hypothetical protein
MQKSGQPQDVSVALWVDIDFVLRSGTSLAREMMLPF